METLRSFFVVSVFSVFMALMASSEAYFFYVGGSDGWVSTPSESYSRWAERSRFQVNDSLVFKYKKGEDSVLVVREEDYDKCNVSNPVERRDTGSSVFTFDRSGPFFFISGVEEKCIKGQKLVVVVLAVRNKPPATPAPTSPSPVSPVSPTLSPSPVSPASPTPSPSAVSPVSSSTPSPSPSKTTPPVSSPPTPSPAPSKTTPPVSSQSPSSPPPTSTISAPSPSVGTSPGPSPASSSSVSIAPEIGFGVLFVVLGGLVF